MNIKYNFQKNNLLLSNPINRRVVFGKNGMVATSQNLAAGAGMKMLQMGGNAIDAVVAMASCLTVVEPCSTSLGSDAFSIIYYKGKMYGMNSSGYSPYEISADKLRNKGLSEMPEYGPIPVTVPGAVKSWCELNKRFGKLSLKTVLEPAIQYAKEGYVLTPVIAKLWEEACEKFKERKDIPGIETWFDTYCINGEIPKCGDIVKLPYHASTLEKIASDHGESFYHGEIAERIEKYVKSIGGYLSFKDMDDYELKWVDPISVNYRGYKLWELPPNGQGIVALMALNVLNGFDFKEKDADAVHKQIEAIKIAFSDAKKYVADDRYMDVTCDELLSPEYARKQRERIGSTSQIYTPGNPKESNTVYMCAADAEGNMVSFIQSSYSDFGSGIVVPQTGIALQNRGYCFNLEEGHANCVGPHKRPYHTIIPGFVTGINDEIIGPLGVMGGFMQPQGHVQLMMDMCDFGMDIQQAIDEPRWQWIKDNNIILESRFEEAVYNDLKNRGHNVEYTNRFYDFGRAQSIFRLDNSAYVGGSESRTDGVVLGM